MIECKICGKKLKIITPSHLNKHNITTNKYKRMFPLSPLWSEEIKNKRSSSMKGKNNPMYGRTHSKKTREKLSYIQTEWCINNNNQFKGKKHNKETRKHLRDIQTGKKLSEKTKTKMSLSHKGLHYNIGKDNPAYGIPVEIFAPKSKGALLKKGIISPNSIHKNNGLSSCEFIVYDYLDSKYSGYVYHNTTGEISFLYKLNKKKYRKFPDIAFLDNDKILFFIEVNGLYWHTINREVKEEEDRLKMIYEQFDYPLLILWEDEIKSGYYKQKIENFLSEIE